MTMHVLEKTNGAEGWYQECPKDFCRRAHANSGNSPSPGWVSKKRDRHCPLCGGRADGHISVARPAEYRIVRQGDGLVMERFPDTDAGKERAVQLLQRLMRIPNNTRV